MSDQATAAAYSKDFFAGQVAGSSASARVMLPIVFDLLGRPDRVADVGCGRGAWLEAAGELGVRHVIGLDGPWVPKSDLLFPADCFVSGDVVDELGRQVTEGTHVDLAICLEVAEHLPAERASALVAGLAGLADAVLFSAAIPHQGGTHHVNEAWPAYWADLFGGQGFGCFDALRLALWHKSEVEWWYAQNSLVFARGAAATRLQERGLTPGVPAALVHPRKYEALWNQYQGILASPAWRATAPVRAAVNLLRRALGVPVRTASS